MTKTTDWHGTTSFSISGNALKIEQRHGDRIDPLFAKLQVRRVTTDERGEHVQIEIEAGKVGKTRITSHHFSFGMTPEHVELFVLALTKAHPPRKELESLYRGSFTEQQAFWSKFYGLGGES